jgi:hypothetical protein
MGPVIEPRATHQPVEKADLRLEERCAFVPVRPITTMKAMDESRLLGEVSRVLKGVGDRERKAAGIAEAIRRSGGYRWVGLYEVSEDEIANLAFDGPGAPDHPRFPVTRGLSGAAVASGKFEEALRVSGVGRERAIHVGNDPISDIRGAAEVGIDTVLVDRRGNIEAPEATFTIPDLDGLPELLEG